MKRQGLEVPGGVPEPAFATPATVPTDFEQVDSFPVDGLATADIGDTGYPALEEAGIPPVAPGAYDANNVPPAILADPAVQSVIASVAAQQAGPPPVPAAFPTEGETPGPPRGAATPSPAGRPIDEEEDEHAGHSANDEDDDDDDDDEDEDLSATSSRTAGFHTSSGATSTSTSRSKSSVNDIDEEENYGMRLSAKFGWTAIATLAAGYFALEAF